MFASSEEIVADTKKDEVEGETVSMDTEENTEGIEGSEDKDVNKDRIPSTGSNADVEDLSDGENFSKTAESEEGEEKTPTKGGSTKLFRFPQGRIKQIMKMDTDVNMVNGEAIFLVNKAVEEFIQCLAVESYHHTAHSKKKTIMKEHVLTAIESNDELAFLDGAMDD